MAVAKGEIDIGVVAEQLDGVDVQFIPYREDRLVVITPLNHNLQKTPLIQFAQVLQTHL
jgi:DNA-binding transcriptional LysR family regulator